MSFFTPSDPFEPPSLFQVFFSSPPKFVLRCLYRVILFIRSTPKEPNNRIRVVCISDTHLKKPHHIPDGDVLIHAGDLTNAGTPSEIQGQIDWLNSLPHTHKVAIAGNHDTYLDPRARSTLDAADRETSGLRWGSVRYLQHSSTLLEFAHHRKRKLRIYGAPQLPACGGPEHAFQYSRGTDAWSETVPLDTDVLITHTPPKHHADLPVGLGCEFLLQEVWHVQPILHVFGHVHAGRGREVAHWDEAQRVYERGCTRRDGFLTSSLNVFLWFDVVMMACHGLSSLVWKTVWGGEERASWLVNASLTYSNTGRLDNVPQVVDI